ncbi:MAG: hypothetical protein ACTSUE_20210 [Promethearchaeota archaeon]
MTCNPEPARLPGESRTLIISIHALFQHEIHGWEPPPWLMGAGTCGILPYTSLLHFPRISPAFLPHFPGSPGYLICSLFSTFFLEDSFHNLP